MIKKTNKRLLSFLTAFIIASTSIPNISKEADALSITYTPTSGYKESKYYSQLTSVNLTGNQITDLINVAQSQEGYHEGSYNGYSSGTNNLCEYNYWYYKKEVSGSNYSWCGVFISWCAEQAGIPTSIIKKNAWAGDMEQTKKKGNFGGTYYPKGSITPQAGDIVYYDGSDVNNSSGHVEIVISYNASNNTICSIGGNTGTGAVIIHNNRSVSKSGTADSVVGFERPNYTDSPSPIIEEDKECGIPYPRPQCSSTHWIGKGGVTSGNEVKWVQTALNMANNAGLTVDGAWGSKSEAATKAFQKKYGLTQDGQAGKATIKKLVEILTKLDAPVAELKYSTPRTATFSWNAVNGATGYKITFRKSGDDYAVKEENFNGTSYTVSGLSPDTQYYFRVYAKNSSTTSARSETVGAKTPANTDVGTDFYAYITHAKSGKVIGRNSSNNVELQTKNTSNTAQLWKFVRQKNGSYVIYNGKDKEFKGVLDSTGVNTSGANVYVYDSFVSSNAQYWYIFKTGSNYSFYTDCTDCTLDLSGYNEKDGTNIQMATYSGNTAQQYKIEKVSCPHNYSSWTTTKNPTCTNDGTKTRKCSLCGNTETENIAKTGHKYKNSVVNPTCTEKGYTLHTCTECGNSYKDSEKNATGHSFGSWTVSKAATCTTDGTETHKCNNCNYSESRTISKTGHKYIAEVIAPSCTNGGYTLHTCTECGNSYKDDEKAVIGHNFTGEYTDGYMIYTCSECGYNYKAPFMGEGTEENPFIISDAEELRALSETVNNTTLNTIFGHAHYRQTADIDLENISWIPIGLGYDGEDGKGEYNYKTRVFYGIYDGNQHSIYNLNVDKDWYYSGLFAIIRDGASIYNLAVYGNVNGENLVGGIVGELQYNSSIENCSFTGDINGGKYCSGGITGRILNIGTVRNCYHNGNVTGNGNSGGIAGDFSFNKWVSDDAEGSVVENCYHVNGDVSGTKAGAITSYCIYNDNKTNPTNIRNCYASGGSYADKNQEATYDNTMILPDSLLKKIAEDLGDAYTENPDSSLNNGFPVFSWQIVNDLKGDADNNGIIDENDAIMLQEWLLGSGELINWENADLCHDGVIDVFDMIIMMSILNGNK